MEQILEKPKLELRTAQRLFLDKVDESRKKGNTKGLLIFATGLGKTLASLSDALNVAGEAGKILVLAHNHNLLYQHAKDFRLLNKTKKIGFLYKSKKDVGAEVLFANIMTLKQERFLKTFNPHEFDYIIIDETHHAGAKSYKKIFDYFKPKFLLGMTATPNRTDQIDILQFYENNIIIEIDCFEAINKGWLRPYKYVFLWDKWCNYKKVKSYRAKSGNFKYDVKELGKAYFIPERDHAIVKEFKKRAGNRRGIGFCVSVDESIRMAKLFNDNGIKAVAVWGGSAKGRTMEEDKRNKIINDFSDGKYQIIFNCEVIGEGLHLPGVDIVLKLRPTMSRIKDSQHSGRGLYNVERLGLNDVENQEQLLILDWVGNYNRAFENYTYQGKSIKNHSNKDRDVRKVVKLPLGCEVEFEERVIKWFNKDFKKRYGFKQFRKNTPKFTHLKQEFGEYYKSSNRRLSLRGFSNFYFNKHGYHINYLIYHHYGSWNKFLIKMGLKTIDKNKLYEEYYKNNLSLIAINKKYHIGRISKLRALIEGYGWEIKSQGYNRRQKTLSKIDNIIKDYNKGFSMREIGRRNYLTCGTVSREINIRGMNVLSREEAVKRYYKGVSLNKCSAHNLHNLFSKWINTKKNKKMKNTKNQLGITRKDFLKDNGLNNSDLIRNNLNLGKLLRYTTTDTPNIKIISNYNPKSLIIPVNQKKKGEGKTYQGLHKEEFKSKEDKVDIRNKIISKIKDGDNVLLLESPDLSALKGIEKRGIKPNKIVIPNHLEFKRLAKELQSFKTNLNIECINTSALQYLVDSEEKFDFIWLDYCGAFSYYMKDLDILFAKHFGEMKLILTYNLFDPAKEDDNYYFTRVIDYVLDKISGKSKVRLINDVTYRYKKNMYNLGFNIEKFGIEERSVKKLI